MASSVGVGAVVDAWSAETGEPLWQIPLESAGQYVGGPPARRTAGRCISREVVRVVLAGRGETIAVDPKRGVRLWSSRVAYATRTGTPSIQGERLILPGSHRRPMASLSQADGQVEWERGEWTQLELVHAASIASDFFTVNTKYRGGAMMYELESGERRLLAGREINLAGQGHTCGTIVLLASGHAVAAANKGIHFTDTKTGELDYETPGFASQTCPHPVFANGRMFYAPQDYGIVYGFEPVPR